ncbi:MAG TPA: hypothetical protein VGP20_04220, partial [Steroidobacteraceae bacterium]|nr:hypothetical protein [Steroidobacteraceae bacterium]
MHDRLVSALAHATFNPYKAPMSVTLQLTQELIARASVTPADEGCQELLAQRLARAGFEVEKLRYGNVDNFWA